MVVFSLVLSEVWNPLYERYVVNNFQATFRVIKKKYLDSKPAPQLVRFRSYKSVSVDVLGYSCTIAYFGRVAA